MAEGRSSLNPARQQRPPFWRDIRVLQLVGQFLFALVVFFVIWQLINNVLNALSILGQTPDFRFWLPDNFFQQPGRLSFNEGPGLVSSDTFGRAFIVGIINTLRVVILGMILATLLGIVVGVARLSRNWLVRNIAGIYVELFQNTPLLLQLIFVYRGAFLALPEIQNAATFPSEGFHDLIVRGAFFLAVTVLGVVALWYLRSLLRIRQGLGGRLDPGNFIRMIVTLGFIGLVALVLFALPVNSVYISQRGLVIPAFSASSSLVIWLIVVAAALISTLLIARQRIQLEIRTGQPGRPILYSVTALVVILILAALVIREAPFLLDFPVPQIAQLSNGTEVIRRINGGETISSEYAALTVGLILYTAAFIGEIVRAGIQAVSYGQTEAAQAVGLSKSQTLRLIILPQALRIIIPPLGNQYLNLTKNSSLATAIAFLDVFAISKTIIHQAGRGVVTIIAVMIVYLIASFVIAGVMNWLNVRMSLKER